MKNKKEKRQIGRKYNKLSSLWWAVKRLYKLDRALVILTFAAAPVAVTLPLVRSWFSKVLIDSIGVGTDFAQLVVICASFLAGLFGLTILKFTNTQQHIMKILIIMKMQL